MAIYVGVSMWPFRNFIMCHMFADTEEELDEMADKIGLNKSWKQKRHTGDVHYDISKSKRELAVKQGAIACNTIAEEVDAWEKVKG